jgi:hypothetical protein
MALWFLKINGSNEAFHLPRAEALLRLATERLKHPNGTVVLLASDGTCVEPADPPPMSGQPLTASFLTLARRGRLSNARKGM